MFHLFGGKGKTELNLSLADWNMARTTAVWIVTLDI
jgi:hypothetical protein